MRGTNLRRVRKVGSAVAIRIVSRRLLMKIEVSIVAIKLFISFFRIFTVLLELFSLFDGF